jgi:peroxiredoxin Q/BCP
MNAGDLAPDFTLTTDDGGSFTLSQALANGPVVLFFYPAAMTKGCTKESCHFRDMGAAYQAAGVQRIGISMDDVAKQAQFTEANRLDYPLLSDPQGHVAALYGVKRAFDFLKVKRSTFAIGTDQRIVEVISSEFSMEVHAERALEVLTPR